MTGSENCNDAIPPHASFRFPESIFFKAGGAGE